MQGVTPRHNPIPVCAPAGGGYRMRPEIGGQFGKHETGHEAPVGYLHASQSRTAPYDLRANKLALNDFMRKMHD